MCLANSLEEVVVTEPKVAPVEFDLTLEDIDDEELDSYIMSEDEIMRKNGLWHKHNATYLADLKRMYIIITFFLYFKSTSIFFDNVT